MEEITATKATGPNALPTGAIIKEAWQICTTFFWPLTLAILLIQIPEKILVSIAAENQSWKVSFLYEAFISGFVFVGVYRTIYRLKSHGIPPTLSDIYAEGQPFYGRNFRLVFSSNLLGLIVILGLGLMIFPCFMLLRDSNKGPWSYVPLTTSIIIGSLILTWLAARFFIYRAALADDASGATFAIEEAFRLTKGKALKVLPLLLCMLGFLMVFAGLHVVTYFLIAGGFENEISKGTEIKINMISALPFAFMEALGISMAALAYLHLRDESRSAAAAASSAAPEAPPS
jgi:hypothetical protein